MQLSWGEATELRTVPCGPWKKTGCTNADFRDLNTSYLCIQLSVWLRPLLLCLVDLAIQIPFVRLPWFAWWQGFVILSFHVPLKGQHQSKAAQFSLGIGWCSEWTDRFFGKLVNILTSHSVCECKWQRWCSLDFLPAHRTLSSKGVAPSPVESHSKRKI